MREIRKVRMPVLAEISKLREDINNGTRRDLKAIIMADKVDKIFTECNRLTKKNEGEKIADFSDCSLINMPPWLIIMLPYLDEVNLSGNFIDTISADVSVFLMTLENELTIISYPEDLLWPVLQKICEANPQLTLKIDPIKSANAGASETKDGVEPWEAVSTGMSDASDRVVAEEKTSDEEEARAGSGGSDAEVDSDIEVRLETHIPRTPARANWKTRISASAVQSCVIQ